jgi:L,D-transpeptidase ErfK/SrfK
LQHTASKASLNQIAATSLAFVMLLPGCSVLERLPFDSAPDVASGEPPIVSDRFLLESDSQQIVGQLQVMTARYEDTFVDIARTYNLGYDELVQANPDVDPWLPGEGTEILLPTRFVLPDAPRRGIVINVAAKRLFYYTEPDEAGLQAVVTYPIGIGKVGAATPFGNTKVTAKGRDPVWHVPASIRREYAEAGNPLPAQVPPGPDNPLGKFVLILDMPSYLIHGTNKPSGVGMRVSHGCVRLFPENIEHLYGLAGVGTEVTIVNQPLLFVWENEALIVEAHPPLTDDGIDWDEHLNAELQTLQAEAPKYAAIDELRIRQAFAKPTGIPLAALSNSPSREAILAAAPRVNNLVAYEPIGDTAIAGLLPD